MESNSIFHKTMYTCSPYTVSTPFMAPNSLKDDDIMNQVSQELIKTAKEPDRNYKIVKISKNQLKKIIKEEVAVEIKPKSCSRENSSLNLEKKENSNLIKDWKELPKQVREEVINLTIQKESPKRSKNCPCNYTHGLIQLYHNAQLLRENAEIIEANKFHHKPSISYNDVNFFKDDCTCNTLIKEIKTQKHDMKKLINLYEKMNEKLKFNSEDCCRNEKSLKELNKIMQQVLKITKEFEPQGEIFHLKKEQQTIEMVFMNRAIQLEEEEMCKAKKEIKIRLKQKEERREKEKFRDKKRCEERRMDTLLVLKSTNLMANYIEELKNEINF